MTIVEDIIEQFRKRMDSAHNLIKVSTFTGAIALAFAFSEMYAKLLQGGTDSLIGFAGLILTAIATPIFLVFNLLLVIGTGIYALFECLSLACTLPLAAGASLISPPEAAAPNTTPAFVPLDPSALSEKTRLRTIPEEEARPAEEETSFSDDEEPTITYITL